MARLVLFHRPPTASAAGYDLSSLAGLDGNRMSRTFLRVKANSKIRRQEKDSLALGIMSGTSADGIDIALVRISDRGAALENFGAFPFPARVRDLILRLGEGRATTTGEISQLNVLLGEIFGDAALAACRKFRVQTSKI